MGHGGGVVGKQAHGGEIGVPEAKGTGREVLLHSFPIAPRGPQLVCPPSPSPMIAPWLGQAVE